MNVHVGKRTSSKGKSTEIFKNRKNYAIDLGKKYLKNKVQTISLYSRHTSRSIYCTEKPIHRYPCDITQRPFWQRICLLQHANSPNLGIACCKIIFQPGKGMKIGSVWRVVQMRIQFPAGDTNQILNQFMFMGT